jgi:hypothetical protein
MPLMLFLLAKLMMCLTILLYSNIIGIDIGFMNSLRRQSERPRLQWTSLLQTSLSAVVIILYNLRLPCMIDEPSYTLVGVIEKQIFFLAIGMIVLEHSATRSYLAHKWTLPVRKTVSLFGYGRTDVSQRG